MKPYSPYTKPYTSGDIAQGNRYKAKHNLSSETDPVSRDEVGNLTAVYKIDPNLPEFIVVMTFSSGRPVVNRFEDDEDFHDTYELSKE